MDDEATNTSQVEDVEFDGFNVTTDENNEKTYNCKTCDTVKDNPKGIKLHIAMKHKHKKPKPKPSTGKIIEESLDGGDFDPLVHSTQVTTDEIRRAEEIANMYAKKEEPTAENDDQAKKNDVEFPEASFLSTIPSQMLNVPDDSDILDHHDLDSAKAEILILQSKLKEVTEELKMKDQKLSEYANDLVSAQVEMSNISDEITILRDENNTKDQQNEMLISEKNSLQVVKEDLETKNETLQEKVDKYTHTVNKIFGEKEHLEKEIKSMQNNPKNAKIRDTAKEVVELDRSFDTNSKIKQLADKLKTTKSDLQQANEDKKRLAKELATLQKTDEPSPDVEDDDKVIRLTSLLKEWMSSIVNMLWWSLGTAKG